MYAFVLLFAARFATPLNLLPQTALQPVTACGGSMMSNGYGERVMNSPRFSSPTSVVTGVQTEHKATPILASAGASVVTQTSLESDDFSMISHGGMPRTWNPPPEGGEHSGPVWLRGEARSSSVRAAGMPRGAAAPLASGAPPTLWHGELRDTPATAPWSTTSLWSTSGTPLHASSSSFPPPPQHPAAGHAVRAAPQGGPAAFCWHGDATGVRGGRTHGSVRLHGAPPPPCSVAGYSSNLGGGGATVLWHGGGCEYGSKGSGGGGSGGACPVPAAGSPRGCGGGSTLTLTVPIA